jgi:hypothetical protein
MHITTPQLKNSDLLKSELLKTAISKFEISFLEEEMNEDYYHLVVDEEYDSNICAEIEKLYINAGWYKAVCKTSSSKGERYGLTGLQLWRK